MPNSALTPNENATTSYNFLSLEGWFYYSQLMLKDTYLQPLTVTANGSRLADRVKNNTCNGYIEREIHGAMHASRVAWSTGMIHQLCKTHYPTETHSKFNALMTFTGFSEEQLLALIRYVGLGHDAARKGEGYDAWEKQSATFIKNFLIEHKLESQQATFFSKIALFKDKPDELNSYLSENRLVTEVIAGFQYARLLVCLADCYDIIRCTGNFKFEVIEQKLSQVFSYCREKDASVFFQYAVETFKLLQRQKDLYFPTQLKGPNSETYSLQKEEEEYSVSEKVRLEHANSATGAMLNSINQNPYFQQLLHMDGPENANEYGKSPAFNPYIHGTNSTALALMTQTDFKLMSPLEMIEHYGFAPFGGEITAGGFSSATANGNVCFAKLSGEDNSNEYTLKNVLSNYSTIMRLTSKEDCLKHLIPYITNPEADLFANINIINIYLVRARQLGINLQEIPGVHTLITKFKLSVDILYLYLLFSTHIIAKSNTLAQLPYEEESKVSNEIYEQFGIASFFEKLQNHNISIKNIYHNPTAKNCQKLLTLFDLYVNGQKQTLFKYTDSPLLEFEEKQLGTQLKYVVKNGAGWSFQSLVSNIATQFYSRVDFKALAPHLIHYIHTLEKRFDVTQLLLSKPRKELLLASEDKDLIENPFPIVICYTQYRHMRIITMETQEYRAEKSLTLGQDIQIIATDTAANKLRLNNYCSRHNLQVKTILFSDLEHVRDSLKSDTPLTNDSFLPYPIAFPTQAAEKSNLCTISSASQVSVKKSQRTPKLECPNDTSSLIEKNNDDIIALRNFCDSQKARIDDEQIHQSLMRFSEKSKVIILSSASSIEKRKQLKTCAHQEFTHRHYLPRLLADVLLCISLLGLAVNTHRFLSGNSFFFSNEKTNREKNFSHVADNMMLDTTSVLCS